MEQYELLIVGAGIFGLAMAKTYTEVHPTARILILDANKSVGGTWSQERLYDGLQTNNHVGKLEYANFPMDFESFGVKPGTYCPGPVLHKYLTAYAQHFGFYDKIRFQALATSAELREENDWLVSYDWEDENGETKRMKVLAEKLVMATGTTSEPFIPSIPGMADFGGEMFHSKELPIRKEDMNAAKNVVVLGGSKSAADAVYLNASQGRHVDWVIRESGVGPAWLSELFVSPANISVEQLATTRIVSFLSATFDLDGYPRIRYLLHNTRLGRAFVRGFFSIVRNDIITRAKYNDHPETQKLIPKANVSWFGTKVGILNYPTSLFDLVHQGLIHIHVSDVTSISPHTIHLDNTEAITADLLIFATGYSHRPLGGFTFLPPSLNGKTGFHTDSLSSPSVIAAADEEIMRRFPTLKSQPPGSPACSSSADINTTTTNRNYLLYRSITPPHFLSPNLQNLAYAGLSVSLRGFLVSSIQALWITAFFSGKLTPVLPDQEEAKRQALLQNRFWKWRVPMGLGKWGPDLSFEILPHVDTLLRDLGLETRRKGGWRELFEWYGVADYAGLVGEWVRKEGVEKGGEGEEVERLNE